jgi:hypothetical protein
MIELLFDSPIDEYYGNKLRELIPKKLLKEYELDFMKEISCKNFYYCYKRVSPTYFNFLNSRKHINYLVDLDVYVYLRQKYRLNNIYLKDSIEQCYLIPRVIENVVKDKKLPKECCYELFEVCELLLFKRYGTCPPNAIDLTYKYFDEIKNLIPHNNKKKITHDQLDEFKEERLRYQFDLKQQEEEEMHNNLFIGDKFQFDVQSDSKPGLFEFKTRIKTIPTSSYAMKRPHPKQVYFEEYEEDKKFLKRKGLSKYVRNYLKENITCMLNLLKNEFNIINSRNFIPKNKFSKKKCNTGLVQEIRQNFEQSSINRLYHIYRVINENVNSEPQETIKEKIILCSLLIAEHKSQWLKEIKKQKKYVEPTKKQFQAYLKQFLGDNNITENIEEDIKDPILLYKIRSKFKFKLDVNILGIRDQTGNRILGYYFWKQVKAYIRNKLNLPEKIEIKINRSIARKVLQKLKIMKIIYEDLYVKYINEYSKQGSTEDLYAGGLGGTTLNPMKEDQKYEFNIYTSEEEMEILNRLEKEKEENENHKHKSEENNKKNEYHSYQSEKGKEELIGEKKKKGEQKRVNTV